MPRYFRAKNDICPPNSKSAHTKAQSADCKSSCTHTYLVNDYDVVSAREEGVGNPAADEPRPPGDQDGLLAGVRHDLQLRYRNARDRKPKLETQQWRWVMCVAVHFISVVRVSNEAMHTSRLVTTETAVKNTAAKQQGRRPHSGLDTRQVQNICICEYVEPEVQTNFGTDRRFARYDMFSRTYATCTRYTYIYDEDYRCCCGCTTRRRPTAAAANRKEPTGARRMPPPMCARKRQNRNAHHTRSKRPNKSQRRGHL